MLKFFSTPAAADQANKASIMLTGEKNTNVYIVEVGTPTELYKLLKFADSKNLTAEYNGDLCWVIRCFENHAENV
jgi:hypothetical protein